MKFDKLLKNKYLYYAAVVLMVINLLGYVAMGSIECILVLGGAAYLAQHFTKNRTVDILIGIFVANILFGCGRLREGFREGMEQVADGAAKAATEARGERNKKKLLDALTVQGVASAHCKGKDCKQREGNTGSTAGGAGGQHASPTGLETESGKTNVTNITVGSPEDTATGSGKAGQATSQSGTGGTQGT